MRNLLPLLVFLGALLAAMPGWPQDHTSSPEEPSEASGASVCEPPAKCVPEKDLDLFLAALQEKRCLITKDPEIELDPINIVVDKKGRIFYSGAAPDPYIVKMTWCDYEIEAKGDVDVTAAMQVSSIWGFSFRPKAYIGFLPFEALYDVPEGESLEAFDLIDAGGMVDFFHYDWFNLNAALGFRSFGGGAGFDLTENFGIHASYALTWASWQHNANIGFWFSFYNPE